MSVRAAVAALILPWLVVGCTPLDTEPAQPSAAPSATVPETSASEPLLEIQPGGPGEAASTLAPGTSLRPAGWNDEDVDFLNRMIPHHRQALDMSELARTRARDPRVAMLAERVEAAQGPEIVLMASFLDQLFLPVPEDHPDHGHHEMAGMVGMLTPGQMERLEAAEGAGFDQLFLLGMIRHHRGAVAMALEVLTTGENALVNELAADVTAGQSAEIERMRGLLRSI